MAEDKVNGAGKYKEIPGTYTSDFFLGRSQLDLKNPLNTANLYGKLYGEIFRIRLLGQRKTFVGSQRMVNAILSRPDCEKAVHEFLDMLRPAVGTGLFTARIDEPEWGMAHRILVPAFGVMSVRGMWDDMSEIASTMLTRWHSHQGEVIDLPDQLTRLTLDTISLCSFGYRFNSFYKEEMHPFIGDMLTFLGLSGERTMQPVSRPFKVASNWRRLAAGDRMKAFALQILEDRRASTEKPNDLATRMLDFPDPETGKTLPDDNIVEQLITFLIAGHETTSGLLSFCLYYMVKNPHTMRKAQAEVDAIGDITLDSLQRMPYIDACLKEALRLQPTAPMIGVCCKGEVPLPDGYTMEAGEEVMINLHALHNDPAVWESPSEFMPERMMDGKFEALPPNSWKPFGHGMRACIGRAFAIQEAMLAVASIIQNFDIELADSQYELKVKFTLTIKPDNLMVKLKRRQSGPPILPVDSKHKATKPNAASEKPIIATEVDGSPPMLVLYGSNSGSCEALAKEVYSDANRWGFEVTLDTLDSCRKLPIDRPVVIVTPSYEGKPADNARQFAAYLDSKPDLKGVQYAIFGAGHHDWVQTYQKVPRMFDEQLTALGGKAIVPRAEGDVAGDFIGDFESWKADIAVQLQKATSGSSKTTKDRPSMSRAASRAVSRAPSMTDLKQFSYEPLSSGTLNSVVSAGLGVGTVVSNEELVQASELGPSKRHLTITLPEDQHYRVGDYLSILPVNPEANVKRVLAHFGMNETTKVLVRARGLENSATSLPVRAFDILQTSVELASPLSKRMLSNLADLCENSADKDFIKSLDGDAYQEQVLDRRMSTIDLLEHCKSCKLSFDDYVKSLQSLHQRQYSISSSSLVNAEQATLTIDILSGPAMSGTGDFMGVTSNFLAGLKAGDKIACSVRASANFSLPERVETPVVMFAAGTGIAPFRGFIQERAFQAIAGRNVGKTLLFYGCRTEEDFLHKDELQDLCAKSEGRVEVRHCFSRATDKTQGCKYVQDLILKQRAEVLELFQQGARFYTCGSASKLAHGVRTAFETIVKEAEDDSAEQKLAKEVLAASGTNRYAVDIFG
ncbi:cytochrome P450 [Protomyces lactucae-debilis]|uniref:Cytochrome P450 n=1 Tax=Protomyces lactucae-debilis TaxID=2754530 RepID=A0A1Y2FAG4_PROLT|nr:cytochrome P450 [Protomyces lactucae-debilis]ORY80873.1 cytochrome P450 [Protomyces lactucae-debilis]